MRVVILGAGMIGLHIARELIEEKRDVVLIEKDHELASVASNELDCLVINDDGSRPEILRKAKIANADWFLALTGTDEVNIVACGLASAEAPSLRTVARVENPFYSSLSLQQRGAFGLDMLVNPTMETADAVVRIVDEGFAEDVIPLHDGRLQLRYVSAQDLRGAIGRDLRALRALRAQEEGDYLVAGAVRDGAFIIPDGDYRIHDEDKLYLLGTPASLDAVVGRVAGVGANARKVLIIGATRITERLVERLSIQESKKGPFNALKSKLSTRRRITVLEASRDEGKHLARLHQNIEVVQGDSTEEEVLEKIGAGSADLFICATESQTFNILTAQLGKSLGAKKSIAIALNDRFKGLSSVLDVDALVSMKSVVAATVLELVRKAHIKTIHDFFEDDVEIVELVVSPDSTAADKPLRDLALPKGKGVLVAFIIKGDEAVMPTGDTVLSGGDVVAFIARKTAIAGLERVFGGSGGV